MGDFYRFTGDAAFVKQSWPSIRKAFDYCLSLLDANNGMFRIPAGEWGGDETATFSKELGMTASWIVAARAVRDLSSPADDQGLARECERRVRQAAESLDRLWNSECNCYDHGLDRSGKIVPGNPGAMSYLAWRGIFPDDRARAIVEPMNSMSRLSDWGQIDSSFEDIGYVEGAYETGLVWQFQTAGPLLGLYRYHNTVQAFRTWMAMVELRTFNVRGALPEMLFGTYYHLFDTSVPQFSELSFIPGLVDGILGLSLDVAKRALTFHPHLPPCWPEVQLNRLPFGNEKLRLKLSQEPGVVRAALEISGGEPVSLDFSPAVPAGASITSVLQDGKPISFQTDIHDGDVHVQLQTKLVRSSSFEVRYRGEVAFESIWQRVLDGDTSHNLRVLRT
jgi:glycogen debranching enzyme